MNVSGHLCWTIAEDHTENDLTGPAATLQDTNGVLYQNHI